MMLMAMRPQKTQLTSVYKFATPGSTTFTKRDHAIMFGYVNYQAFVVGGAGGRSGVAVGSPEWRYPSGGGGGSSKLIDGLLTDLSSSVSVTVGSRGSTGADGGATSGAGGRGGNSSFGVLAVGYGGYGGYSANVPNAANKGGEGANPNNTPGPLGGSEGATTATSGTWNSTTKEGSGGGGGNGSGQAGPAASGGSGSGSVYLAPGESGDLHTGGGGGGANIAALTGGPAEYYGTGHMSNTGDGVVVVKLS